MGVKFFAIVFANLWNVLLISDNFGYEIYAHSLKEGNNPFLLQSVGKIVIQTGLSSLGRKKIEEG